MAVRAQLLDAARPKDLVSMVDRLTLLQLDPTAAIAPSADLVAWSRLGPSYRPEYLKQAHEQHRTVFELDAVVRPIRDLGLHLAGASERPHYEHSRNWLRANDRFRRDILKRLASGPLRSRDIPDTSVVPWPSTGWTNDRNVTQMLEFLMVRGEVAITARVGRERIWDLPERVYPPDVEVPSVEEATRRLNERRLGALGIARARTRAVSMEPYEVGDAGEPAVVEGVKGEWRVDPAALGDDFEGRTALLSPFDRLVHDRVRALELFEFEYTIEMYKPAPRGAGATTPCRSSTETGWSGSSTRPRIARLRSCGSTRSTRTCRSLGAMRTAVEAEIESLAAWLGLPSRCPEDYSPRQRSICGRPWMPRVCDSSPQ